MAIDPNIALQAVAPKPIDPLASAAKAFTLKAAMQQAQMGDMELQDQLSLRNAFQDPQARNADGTINFGHVMSEVGGKVSPKMFTTLSTAAQAQEEKRQAMLGQYVQAAGPVAANLFTKYQELSKTVGPEAAWAQVAPQAQSAMADLKQRFPMAPLDPSKLSPEELEKDAMQWGEYAKRQMRGSQPSTPHEKAMEEATRARTAAAAEPPIAKELRASGIDPNSPEGKAAIKKKIEKDTAPSAAQAAAGGFEGKNGELMGALAERGVSLPTGFRSVQQQVGLLNALWKRNPDKSADQIADMVKSGQIDLANMRKMGQVAAGIAGKVGYADKELQKVIPLVREASAKLPRGEFIPYNKLKQMSQSAFSNPDLARFRQRMTMLSNTFDMLAARGGTDAEKRAEARKSFENAQSMESLEAVLQSIDQEAKISGEAAKESMDESAGRTSGGGAGEAGKKRRPLSAFGGGGG